MILQPVYMPTGINFQLFAAHYQQLLPGKTAMKNLELPRIKSLQDKWHLNPLASHRLQLFTNIIYK